MKYCIVTDEFQEDFEEKINKKLKEGWQLCGSVSVSRSVYAHELYDFTECHDLYCQAFIKENSVQKGLKKLQKKEKK